MNLTQKNKLSPIVILLAVAFVLNSALSVNLALCDDIAIFAVLFILSMAVCGFLFSVKGALLGIGSVILGAGIALFLTESLTDTLKAFSILPFGISFMFLTKRRITRMTAVAVTCAFVTIGFLGDVLLNVYLNTGRLGFSEIVSTYPAFFNNIGKFLTSTLTIDIAGDTVSLISKDNIQNYFNDIIAVFPGLLSVFVSLCSFTACYLSKKIMKYTLGIEPDYTSWKIIPSPITAAFFVVAIIFSFISLLPAPILLSGTNIALIMIPSFFISGLNSAFEPKILNGIKYARVFRPLVLIIALFNDITFFIFASTAFGLFDCIKTVFHKKNPTEK